MSVTADSISSISLNRSAGHSTHSITGDDGNCALNAFGAAITYIFLYIEVVLGRGFTLFVPKAVRQVFSVHFVRGTIITHSGKTDDGGEEGSRDV